MAWQLAEDCHLAVGFFWISIRILAASSRPNNQPNVPAAATSGFLSAVPCAGHTVQQFLHLGEYTILGTAVKQRNGRKPGCQDEPSQLGLEMRGPGEDHLRAFVQCFTMRYDQ